MSAAWRRRGVESEAARDTHACINREMERPSSVCCTVYTTCQLVCRVRTGTAGGMRARDTTYSVRVHYRHRSLGTEREESTAFIVGKSVAVILAAGSDLSGRTMLAEYSNRMSKQTVNAS